MRLLTGTCRACQAPRNDLLALVVLAMLIMPAVAFAMRRRRVFLRHFDVLESNKQERVEVAEGVP